MIAGGQYYSLFIDPRGNVWESGEREIDGIIHDRFNFSLIPDLPPITQLSTSNTFGGHSLFLDKEGKLWGRGKNEKTQLGLLEDYIFSATKVPYLPKITMVSCGGGFSLVLDEFGCIWGAGSNEFGQLSCGEYIVKTFTMIDTVEFGKITKICCGSGHSIVENSFGELWGSGHNKQGELGLGFYFNIFSFRIIASDIGEKIKQIRCGANHTLLLDESGFVWGTGMSNNGELGLGYKSKRNTFEKLEDIPLIQHVICGGYSTILIDVNGNAYACGWNSYGQLGLGNNYSTLTPQLIPNLPCNIIQGDTGYQTMLSDEEGGLWVSGFNDHGQLGIGNKETIHSFVKVEGALVRCEGTNRYRKTKRAI